MDNELGDQSYQYRHHILPYSPDDYNAKGIFLYVAVILPFQTKDPSILVDPNGCNKWASLYILPCMSCYDVLHFQTPVIGCREMYTTQQLEILKNTLSAAIATPG